MARLPDFFGFHRSRATATTFTHGVAVLAIPGEGTATYARQLHICQAGDVAIDWAVAAQANPTLYIHSVTTPATEYLSIGGHDGTTSTIDNVGGTTIVVANSGVTVATFGATSVAFDGAVVAGAAFTFNNTQGRAAVTSVGNQVHMPAQSTTFSNASSTLAIGAGMFLGIPTYLGDNATLTFTDAATFYIAGAPVASTNVAITNTALSLWVDAGATRLDGDCSFGGTATSGAANTFDNTAGRTFITSVGTQVHVPAQTQNDTAAAATVAVVAAVNVNTQTYTGTNAMTYTDCATMRIAASPTAGAGVTITRGYALWVDAGEIRADGGITVADRGTVGQVTSKTTGVTLNNRSGAITMEGGSLAAGAEANFTVTNSTIGANDVVIVNHGSAGTAGAYVVSVSAVAAGSFQIVVENVSAGALAEAIVLNFVVIGGDV